MEQTSINVILVFLTSYLSTILIFLNFLAIWPRLEVRYWFFWWLRHKKQFMRLKVHENHKKNIQAVHILTGSRLFYVIKAKNVNFLKMNKETGALILPPLSEIVKDPNAPRDFFVFRQLDNVYKGVFSELSGVIPVVNQKFIYIVAGPSAIKGYDSIYYQGAIRLSSFDQSLKIQTLMFERTWNAKFDQINNSLKK